jgi:hypothetical protein
MSCPRCGTEPVAQARYCHKCGERLAAGVLQLDDDQILDRAALARRLAWVTMGLLVFIGLLWATSGLWLGVEPPPAPPVHTAPPVVAKPEKRDQTYFAVRTTKLRSSKTTETDNIVRTIGRGEQVAGEVEMGEDGKTSWLNTGQAGPYVAMLNLATKAPPPLDLALDLVMQTESPVTLYDQPGDNEGGFSTETVPEGVDLNISGVVGNWFEVKLRKGCVAFFKPASKAEKRVMAKAMAVLDTSEDGEP